MNILINTEDESFFNIYLHKLKNRDKNIRDDHNFDETQYDGYLNQTDNYPLKENVIPYEYYDEKEKKIKFKGIDVLYEINNYLNNTNI
jgi:hypothetical protein